MPRNKRKSLALYRYSIFGLMTMTISAGWTVDTFRDEFYPEIQVQAETVATAPHAPSTNEETGQTALAVATSSAGEVETTDSENPGQTASPVEQKIKEVFGSEADNALKIAKCESGLKADRVGDQHLLGTLDGELVGDSIGLFQIRTGDAGVYDSKPWNRAKANSMTAQEFREALKNPDYNIEYAKEIYERQGWNAWFNCKNKEAIN